MLEGKIIKFYREQQQLKQSDIGLGICSNTHVSKIERGLTEVSGDIIDLLAKRLGIDMQKEIKNYLSLTSLLKKWEDAIIMHYKDKAKEVRVQIEDIKILHTPDFYHSYTLLLARYYLLNNKHHLVKPLIDEMDSSTNHSPKEQNMLWHIKSIYSMKYKFDYDEAISYLRNVSIDEYNNHEYYYDFALAYHSINSRVLAYYYANLALQFFTKHRCFVRMIETEMLMLIQIEQEGNPVHTEYERLIEMTDSLGLIHQQALTLHNYAYQQVRLGNFKKASDLYYKSMKKKDPESPFYLGSLEGFVNALTSDGKTSKARLLSLAEEGLSLANKISSETFIHLFTLHMYKIQEKKDLYYQYIETKAYPYFKENGNSLPSEHYQIVLFDYYMENKERDKANELAQALVDKYRTINNFV
ncbi:helix-turn-helix domain-containing protein [Alteribacter populi]|uniref:helix-turn-helix domain-containing protein n=1 Tax=Alteribacter populi TaxID=2011011 RepID=UPI000BBB0F3A|nr:helix-turn-helix transcriptional regulator [Alteribacter populi]